MREAVRLYAERFPDRVHLSFCFFKHSTNFLRTRSMDNKKRKRIKKATDDGNSTNILAAVAVNPHISLNVKVVLVDEVFCEYSILTNFIPSISHFIKSYMAMIFKIVYNSVNGHYKDYKKKICLSLKSYLLTSYIYKQSTNKSSQHALLVSRKPTLDERSGRAETLVYKRLGRNS